MTTTTTGSRATLDEVLERPRGIVRVIDRLTRGRGVGRRGVLVGAAVAGSALATDPKAYALRPQTAYATICGPANTAAGGWTIFCATIQKGVNACPPGSFTAGWWKAADSSWCGGGYRYIVDCNATCTKCSSGCSDHLCDSKCWNCSCTSGSKATCDQRRNCCNAFRYGQCNTQIKCSGGVHCRVVSCVPPYTWAKVCNSTSLRSDSTAEHSSPYLPQWGPMEKLYTSMGGQLSYLRASVSPIGRSADGRGQWVTYQGGRIWYTPTTGAVAMSSFADKLFLDNGGPFRLGYPKGQRQDTVGGAWIHFCESAAVVSTKTTNQVVWGARFPIWMAEGRETGNLGFPTGPKQDLPNGAWIQRFEKGCIVDSTQTTSRAVYGVRWDLWVANGRETGRLGFPVGPKEFLPAGAWIQRFQKGCITDTTVTPMSVVAGVMWTAWQQVGRETGVLGFPAGADGAVTGGVRQLFQGGGIWGRTGGPAYAVTGAVRTAWEAAGGVTGSYGFPTAHVRANGDGTSTGVFEGGTITA